MLGALVVMLAGAFLAVAPAADIPTYNNARCASPDQKYLGWIRTSDLKRAILFCANPDHSVYAWEVPHD